MKTLVFIAAVMAAFPAFAQSYDTQEQQTMYNYQQQVEQAQHDQIAEENADMAARQQAEQQNEIQNQLNDTPPYMQGGY